MKVFKELEDFENDAAKVGADAYIISFTNYRDKVALAYPEVDLSGIVADGAGLEEEEGGAAAEEGNTGYRRTG